MNNKTWMCVYGAVLALISMGCFIPTDMNFGGGDYSYEEDDYSTEDDDYWDDDYSYDDYSYDDEDGYHGSAAVRQALTAPAPEVSGPGYTSSAFSYNDCQVHAECRAGEVCASDPVCPDYTYCYPIDEAGCDCDDRFNTVCWFGECVLRGVDCADGCPTGTACESELGACIVDGSVTVEPPQPGPQPGDGQKCLRNDDCLFGSCVDGTCSAIGCLRTADCDSDQTCATALNGDRICLARGGFSSGSSCTLNGDCESGYCFEAICRDPCTSTVHCDSRECLDRGETVMPICSTLFHLSTRCDEGDYRDGHTELCVEGPWSD